MATLSILMHIAQSENNYKSDREAVFQIVRHATIKHLPVNLYCVCILLTYELLVTCWCLVNCASVHLGHCHQFSCNLFSVYLQQLCFLASSTASIQKPQRADVNAEQIDANTLDQSILW